MLEQLKCLFTKQELLKGYHGIEREVLRVNFDGTLSTKPHPEIFGDKVKNPYITTDFSESQIEVITPPFSDIEKTYNFTNILYDITALEIREEYLWPQSMPCIITDEEDIPVAQYGDYDEAIEAQQYRNNLLQKYGGKKQLISGIHYNFSFTEEFINKLHENSDKSLGYKDFKDEIYLKVTRNYLRYRWLIIYLLGGTGTVHESFISECKGQLKEISKSNYSNDGALSYRNSKCGYNNKMKLFPNYNSVNEYVDSLKEFISNNLISSHKELYSSIRLKPRNAKDFFDSLLQGGIKYLEYRSIDINPFEKGGISLYDLYFLQIFNLFLLINEENYYDKWQEEALENQYEIARSGQNEIMLKRDGEFVSKTQWALEIFDVISKINGELELGKEDIINLMVNKIKDNKLTYAYRIVKKVEEEGYVNAHLKLAKQYKNDAYNNRFKLEGYEDLELSTQILMKEAIKRGIKVKIIDRTENFISLEKDNRVEYVKQSTKTSKDNYVTVLIMENKSVTKQILNADNIRVPQGIEVNSISEVLERIKTFITKPIVIKPKSTNFGIGISIFKDGANEEDIIKACEIAFKHDNTVLIEEFISGKEFRFLVIGDKVCGVLHRVPANVTGDGEKTIRQLVEIKNQNPLRGYHYVTPLEKIKLDEHAALFLKQQNKNFDYIPEEEEVVYLRENSNISTGGDSLDYTDEMLERFKKIAVDASKSVKAKICGVDMMIEDYSNENSSYAIIELNFNPAIHIHSYPYKGVERKIAVEILKLLEFV